MSNTKMLTEFMDSIREYVRESNTNIAHDDRDSLEFVEIFLNLNPEYRTDWISVEDRDRLPKNENALTKTRVTVNGKPHYRVDIFKCCEGVWLAEDGEPIEEINFTITHHQPVPPL